MIKNNIKIRVTPEQSAKVQEIVLSNGGEWAKGGKTIRNEQEPFLFIDSKNIIKYDDSLSLFEDDDELEVDADFFIRTNGTCEEKKQEVTVDDNGNLMVVDRQAKNTRGILSEEEISALLECFDEEDAPKCKEETDIDTILEERGSRYGDFREHARITQSLKAVMKDTPNWEKLSSDKKETLEMVAHKIGRILNGDPEYADSWVDGEGYFHLVVKNLKGAK